jgi:hypothetical protein
MYYELIINKNISTNYVIPKEEYNRNEIITVFHSMIQPNASTKYPLYHLYEDSFNQFTTNITKISKIINHKTEIDITNPIFMEEDKQILVKPKTKTTSITEMFNKINKTS